MSTSTLLQYVAQKLIPCSRSPFIPKLNGRHLVTWVLQLVAVDVVLLIVWTVMDRPRVVVHTVVDDGAGEKPGRHKTCCF